MKVIVVHNAYQMRGGEDVVVEAEAKLLRDNGHEVIEYRRHNDELKDMTKVGALADAIWSKRTVREMSALLQAQKPDVVHVHNTFPLISPSLYWAAAEAKIPIVQTLHNFRLMCPQAMFLRNGKVCEDCIGRFPWPGVAHGCYRSSRSQTLGVAVSVGLHRYLGTWHQKVGRYIALNEFCRRKFIEGGLPQEKIVVKPNFIEDVAIKSNARAGLLFVGRLSREKGIALLAEAMRQTTGIKLTVAGSGPEEHLLDDLKGLMRVGNLSSQQVLGHMSHAVALVLPSIWYENLPRTLVEAYASGLPVIASRLGALAELVEDGVTGLLFDPSDSKDLAEKMEWATSNPDAMSSMGKNARLQYLEKYSTSRNYRILLSIYESVVAHH